MSETAELLRPGRDGRPRIDDSRAVLLALQAALDRGDEDLAAELLAGAPERFAERVEPTLRTVPAGDFAMGSEPEAARRFCGTT